MAYLNVGSKKLGVEFLFAFLSYIATVYCAYAYHLPYLSDAEYYVFSFVAIYECLIYLNLAFSDPGRHNQMQKTVINEFFRKLSLKLERSKGEGEDYVAEFESHAEALIWRNYFMPYDLINSSNMDARKFRYCDKCEVFKMPRVHHCRMCGQCCVKYDHHCGLAINCIGVNNYHLFILFVTMSIVVRKYVLFSIDDCGSMGAEHQS